MAGWRNRLTCKERTVAGYKYALDRWVLPHVGRCQLRQLRVGHIETMQTSLLDAGLSVSTVRVARHVLSSALSQAGISPTTLTNQRNEMEVDGYGIGPSADTGAGLRSANFRNVDLSGSTISEAEKLCPRGG
jgi:uncharacterized protein YjbI with pentapeptide repeats